jgi:transposase
VNADETGFREQRKKAWLWVAVTPLVTVFLVHLKRGRVAARELLGTFAGTLGSDRWCAYSYWVIEMRQLCWAHLLRHFQAFSEARGASRTIGLKLLAEVHQMFHWWHKVRDGTLKRSTFKRYMAPLKRRVEALLTEATTCRQRWTAATAREVLKLKDALWTFVSTEGVEPTNNAAERALRPAVIWRKVSFGTQSARGSRFVERILTVSATLKQQNRNVLDYLTAACIAKLRNEEPPSLLPPEARPTAVRA